MATRFRYTKVPADYFDLTPAEILMATDAELNSYIGPRKLMPYRPDRERIKVVGRKRKLKELRKALASRKWGKEDEATDWRRGTGKRKFQEGSEHNGYQRGSGGADGEPSKKKRKGRKERLREREATEDAGAVAA
jgi:protein KRI1